MRGGASLSLTHTHTHTHSLSLTLVLSPSLSLLTCLGCGGQVFSLVELSICDAENIITMPSSIINLQPRLRKLVCTLPLPPFSFFITLGLELSDSKVYEP